MGLDEIKTLVEIVQGVVTTIGLLAAGIWSYYTFVRSRGFAPNVKIKFALKSVVELEQAQGVVVGIRIKNIGKTRVDKQYCVVQAKSIIKPKIVTDPFEYVRVDRVGKFDGLGVYQLLENHKFLEPGEEVEEDALFLIGNSPIFNVTVRFSDRRESTWDSNAILDIRQLNKVKG